MDAPISIAMTPGAAAPVTVRPRFALVADVESDASGIITFSVDPATGVFTEVSTSSAVGTAPISVAVDPTGRFAYTANYTSDDITAFSIDQATGALTEVGTEVDANDGPRSMTVEPSGRFAYVANDNSSDVTSFIINQTTGALTELGTEVETGLDPLNPNDGLVPKSIAVDPSGRFAYVANTLSSDVTTFRINPATGVLTGVGMTELGGGGATSIAVEPSGRFAYVTRFSANVITTFSIHPISGALTEVNSLVGDGFARAVAVDPSGRFAYVANDVSIATPGSSTVTSYRIDQTTGALTKVGTEVVAGGLSNSVTVDPSGRFAYVTGINIDDNGILTSTITTLSIDQATGALTEVDTDVAARNEGFVITILGVLQ
jgi:6-phosphogluconolactonase (cycloisomerase 2 family)